MAAFALAVAFSTEFTFSSGAAPSLVRRSGRYRDWIRMHVALREWNADSLGVETLFDLPRQVPANRPVVLSLDPGASVDGRSGGFLSWPLASKTTSTELPTMGPIQTE